MTFRELEQYRSLRKEILEINSDLKKYEIVTNVQRSNPDYPHQMQNHKEIGYAEDAKPLLERLSNIKSLKKRINVYINSIQDSKIRRIFYMRFIQGKSNQYIACMLDYRDEGTIRKIIKKYLINSDFSEFNDL